MAVNRTFSASIAEVLLQWWQTLLPYMYTIFAKICFVT